MLLKSFVSACPCKHESYVWRYMTRGFFLIPREPLVPLGYSLCVYEVRITNSLAIKLSLISWLSGFQQCATLVCETPVLQDRLLHLSPCSWVDLAYQLTCCPVGSTGSITQITIPLILLAHGEVIYSPFWGIHIVRGWVPWQ